MPASLTSIHCNAHNHNCFAMLLPHAASGGGGGGWSCQSPASPGALHNAEGMVPGGQGGINGHAAMSALGSGCACPTAVIAHGPQWRFRRIQVRWRVRASSLPEWFGLLASGLYRVRRTSWSVVTPSPGARVFLKGVGGAVGGIPRPGSGTDACLS